MPKKKFYAVAIGRKCGIFKNWPECEAQTKGFPKARYKSFISQQEADQFIEKNSPKVAVTSCCPEQPVAKKRRLTHHHHLQISIHFDGGSRGNPGTSGSGAQVVVVEVANKAQVQAITDHRPVSKYNPTTFHLRKYIPRATNNVAEYQGVLIGLRKAQSELIQFVYLHRGESCSVGVDVKGDSNIIIMQLDGCYQCKAENLKPLYKEAKSILLEMEKISDATFKFEHVYRKDNAIADRLANEAMDERRSWETIVEHATGQERQYNDHAPSNSDAVAVVAMSHGRGSCVIKENSKLEKTSNAKGKSVISDTTKAVSNV